MNITTQHTLISKWPMAAAVELCPVVTGYGQLYSINETVMLSIQDFGM